MLVVKLVLSEGDMETELKLPAGAASTEDPTDWAIPGQLLMQERREEARRVLPRERGLSSIDEGEAVGVDNDRLAVQAGVGLCLGLEG